MEIILNVIIGTLIIAILVKMEEAWLERRPIFMGYLVLFIAGYVIGQMLMSLLKQSF